MQQHARQQEEMVRQVLDMLHEAMIDLDTPHDDGTQTSYFIDYDEQDMFHAAAIFYSVCSNYAIKHEYLNYDNAYEKVSRFREMIKETFGLDTIQEANFQVLLNSVKNDSKSENNK